MAPPGEYDRLIYAAALRAVASITLATRGADGQQGYTLAPLGKYDGSICATAMQAVAVVTVSARGADGEHGGGQHQTADDAGDDDVVTHDRRHVGACTCSAVHPPTHAPPRRQTTHTHVHSSTFTAMLSSVAGRAPKLADGRATAAAENERSLA